MVPSVATGAVMFLAVVLNGVAVGIMASTVIGIVPFMLSQSYRGYVGTVQFMWPRFDPTMPALNGLTLVLDVALVAVADTPAARVGFALAAALLVGVMAVSITKNVPVNKLVTSLDSASEPADWDEIDPRLRWQKWNRVRTSFALTAFVVNALTAVAIA